jgi:hypothetical protein
MAPKFTLHGNVRSRHKILSLLALILFLLILTATQARASVNFVRISAHWDGDEVSLQWETSSEVDNSGFYIHRSLQQNTGYTVVNEDPIPSLAEEQGGSLYEYIDFNINSNTVYWYRIEAVANDSVSQFSDPVPAGPGVIATPTRTATPPVVGPTPTTNGSPYPAPGTEDPNALNTSTPVSYPGPEGNPSPVPNSPTPTLRSATATLSGLQPALTPSPGGTLLQGTITPTRIQEGSEISTTANLTETATLIPLPNLTLIFPEPTEIALLVTATPEAAPPSPWSTPRRLVPLTLVVMIWVILGAWFYYSQRNIS